MKSNDPIFGYHKVNADFLEISTSLYPDGILLFQTRDTENDGRRDTIFTVTDGCIQKVRKIITSCADDLRQYARQINGHLAHLESENYFVFGDLKIIDWDLSRWYLEESREKYPGYYKNMVKVELTENYVRAIFDEICRVIEEDEKEVQYVRTYCTL